MTTAPQLTRYLLEQSAHLQLATPLTTAELRVLELLPTSSYVETAATLYISRNTVKTHLGLL